MVDIFLEPIQVVILPPSVAQGFIAQQFGTDPTSSGSTFATEPVGLGG